MKRILASLGLAGVMLGAIVAPVSASVPVRVTPTQCIFELHHIQHGTGNVFDAADNAYAVQTTQANSFYQSNYRGWVVACHIQGQWEWALHRYRPTAEVLYVEAITP